MTRILTGCVLALFSTLAHGQTKIETEFTVDLATKYVWRGVNVVNDPVLQPAVTFGLGRFTAAAWANVETTNWNLPNYDSAPRGRVTEINLTGEYSWRYRAVAFKVGLVDYQYSGTGLERYSETYLGVSFGDVPLAPEVTVYRGNRHFTGTALLVGFSHEASVLMRPVTLGMEVGYGDAKNNAFLYGARTAGLTHLNLSASTALELGKGWTLSPSVHFGTLLDRRLLDGQPRRTNAWAQVGLARRF